MYEFSCNLSQNDFILEIINQTTYAISDKRKQKHAKFQLAPYKPKATNNYQMHCYLSVLHLPKELVTGQSSNTFVVGL